MAINGAGDLYDNSVFMLGKLLFKASNYFILDLTTFISLLILGASVLYSWIIFGVFRHANKNTIDKTTDYATVFFLPVLICWCIPVSADYRLNYFVMSVYFVIMKGDRFFGARTRYFLLALYFLILTPKHFLSFGSLQPFNNPSGGYLRFGALAPTAVITLQAIVNPILMFILCVALAVGLKNGIKNSNHSVAPSLR